MVRLRGEEAFAENNLGVDAATATDPLAFCARKRRRVLVVVMAEQRRSVLRTTIRHGWIVPCPEQLQQLLERQQGWVVDQIYGFGVICEVVVRRVARSSTGVTDFCTQDTIKTPEPGVGSPESAECKGEAFRGRMGVVIDGCGHTRTITIGVGLGSSLSWQNVHLCFRGRGHEHEHRYRAQPC